MSYNQRVDITNHKRIHSRTKQALVFALQGLNHLLWPAVCISCGKGICETDKNLCKDCWDQLLTCTAGDYCIRCGKDATSFAMLDGACPDCQGKEIHFDRIVRCGVYTQTLRKMILAFKNGRTELGPMLGSLVNSSLASCDFSNDIDFFVPVPLHFSRRLSRGYNQALLLSKRLKQPSGKINTDLVRIRRTKAQAVLPSVASRRANVAGAFAVRNGHRFAGRTICLVDDIKTTGATLNECAKILKQAGAEKVLALTLAVAGQKTS